MKIPALTDLAKDVKKIADALTRLAETAEELVNQQGPGDTEAVESLDLLDLKKTILIERIQND